jgi:hypothetical protein
VKGVLDLWFFAVAVSAVIALGHQNQVHILSTFDPSSGGTTSKMSDDSDEGAGGWPQLLRWILADDQYTARAIRLTLALATAVMIILAAAGFVVHATSAASVGGALLVGATAMLRRRMRR